MTGLSRYIYNVNYQSYEKELCILEIKALFGGGCEKKVCFSHIEINPSISPYIKNRLKILCEVESLDEVVQWILDREMMSSEFVVKYYRLISDDPEFKNRRKICEAIGLSIKGLPNFTEPKIIYGITCYNNHWYFGELSINNRLWKVHNKKPYSYSSSLSINIAKAIANIASGGDPTKKIIDPCCGVGTVIIEGMFAGYNIEGREINPKVAKYARANLAYYNYQTEVTTGDIGAIKETYDASIVDLPYGKFSSASTEDRMYIIREALRISKKVVLVVSKDIRERLLDEGVTIEDYCKVSKKSIKSFTRYIIVCFYG